MVGIFFLSWAFFVVVTALIAGSKNRSAGLWALAALFFGVFATVAVACVSKLPTAAELKIAAEASASTKACPMCAESVLAAAKICRFCGHHFDVSTIPAPPEYPWTLETDHGNGFGVYRYKGEKLVYSSKGVAWRTSSFDTVRVAIKSIDAYLS